MRVALYYPWVYLTSGAERVIYELAVRSPHDYAVFTNHFNREQTFPELQQVDVREVNRISVRRSMLTSAVNCGKLLLQKLPLGDFDCLVVLCEGLGDFVTFRNNSIPTVCICLTPLRAAFDPFYREEALGKRTGLQRYALQQGLRLFGAVDRLAWKNYDHAVCISNEVKSRVLAASLAAPEKLSVAYPGVGFAGREPSQTFDRYFLLPGRIMWTKNIELGIQAFQQFRQNTPAAADFRLVIAGVVDSKSTSYLQRLRQLAGEDSNIEFRIHPSEDELAKLYENCYGVLFTAFNEDFGIVPLEGMAFGKPVIAVNRGGPTETIEHNRSGFLEEPEPAAFASRMSALVADPILARKVGSAGPEQAARFSWDSFTNYVDHVVEKSVSERRGNRVAGAALSGIEA